MVQPAVALQIERNNKQNELLLNANAENAFERSNNAEGHPMHSHPVVACNRIAFKGAFMKLLLHKTAEDVIPIHGELPHSACLLSPRFIQWCSMSCGNVACNEACPGKDKHTVLIALVEMRMMASASLR